MPEQLGKRLTLNAAFFREIKEDHQQLQKLLCELGQLIENRVLLANHPRLFLELLDKLVDQLGLHFTLEEAYGYFEHSLEEKPEFHDQAVRLRDQHSGLYTSLQQIAEMTGNEVNKNPPQLDELADQFAEFLKSLNSHESAEHNLIMEALNRDVGGGD